MLDHIFSFLFFFFNDPATTEIYTLSLHDALPIYGGVSGIYDFGPLGVELRNNIRRYWWWSMVQLHDNIVGIEGAIITHPRVWEASGHVENFVDRLVDCKNCKRRFRIDHLPEENVIQNKCPECGGELM